MTVEDGAQSGLSGEVQLVVVGEGVPAAVVAGVAAEERGEASVGEGRLEHAGPRCVDPAPHRTKAWTME